MEEGNTESSIYQKGIQKRRQTVRGRKKKHHRKFFQVEDETLFQRPFEDLENLNKGDIHT